MAVDTFVSIEHISIINRVNVLLSIDLNMLMNLKRPVYIFNHCARGDMFDNRLVYNTCTCIIIICP